MQYVGETKKQSIILLVGGLALTASLSWNEAIKSSIEEYFPVDKGTGSRAKLLYAVLITLILAIITMLTITYGVYAKPATCVCASKEEVSQLRGVVNDLAAKNARLTN